MKRLLLFFACGFVSLSVYSQIFNQKVVLDKFDDIIERKYQKTLIQKTDSTFIIEEKGREPQIWIIGSYNDFNSMGSKDNIVNLINNVYGYQECWSIVKKEDAWNCSKASIDIINERDREKSHKLIREMVEKYYYYIIHRVVTTQYSHSFVEEMYWIEKGDDQGRTIYRNQNM